MLSCCGESCFSFGTLGCTRNGCPEMPHSKITGSAQASPSQPSEPCEECHCEGHDAETKHIFVLGEAFKPGMYTIGALSTLTNAVFDCFSLRIYFRNLK